MKMETPVLQVIRFDAEDVIATSGGGGGSSHVAAWSEKSFQTLAGMPYECSAVGYDVEFGGLSYIFNANTKNPVEGGFYNCLDGQSAGNAWGEIFTEGHWYHFDGESGVDDGMYWNWKTCTDPSHHYNGSN